MVEVGAADLSNRAAAVLGHPAHPALTDLPIGFWTSAWVLDVVAAGDSGPAARRLVGLGVLTAVPTAVVGLGDATALPPWRRRTAILHAAANVGATGCYAVSWMLRGRPHAERSAKAVGWVGAALATVGGTLGGSLAFGGDRDQPMERESTRSRTVAPSRDRRAHEAQQ